MRKVDRLDRDDIGKRVVVRTPLFNNGDRVGFMSSSGEVYAWFNNGFFLRSYPRFESSTYSRNESKLRMVKYGEDVRVFIIEVR
jgi:hypothetical protein